MPSANRTFSLVSTFLVACVAIFCLLWLWGSPVAAQEFQPDGLTGPENGAVIAGVVLVQGTANHPDFLRYELSFYKEFDPYAGWIIFAEGNQPVISDTLAVWDTTVGRAGGAPVFPDGLYRLRLRVVRQDYNYDEFFILQLTVSNDTATPTPTLTPTVTSDPAQAGNPAAIGTPAATDPAGEIVIAPLPSLTPFPSPTAPPTVEGGAPAPPPEEPLPAEDPVRAIFARLQTLEAAPYLNAAWLGIRLALLAFGALALYLLIRAIGRWLWLQVVRRSKKTG